MSLDVEMQLKLRNILLALHNCTTHPHMESFKNIQPEFLSRNTTSLVQPMDMGIIKI
jgi:hypothetical protein